MIFIADDMPKNGSKTSISVNGFVCYCQTTVLSKILVDSVIESGLLCCYSCWKIHPETALRLNAE